MTVSEWLETKFERICDEIEVKDPIEVVRPQIELDLGEGSSIHDVEPPVKVPGVVPTMEVEEEDSSVEMLVPEKEMKRDQAEGTGTEPVPEDAELSREGQSVGTEEPVLEVDRSGEQPDMMEVDQTGRTGDAPVHAGLEERIGAKPVLEEAVEDAGPMPFRETGEGDLHFDDYPGDDFEKVGEFTPEETSQTPPAPVQEQPVGTPSSTEPRKKRIKTLAGRTDLP